MGKKRAKKRFKKKFQPKGMAQAAGMSGQSAGQAEEKAKSPMLQGLNTGQNMAGFKTKDKKDFRKKDFRKVEKTVRRDELKPKMALGNQTGTQDALYEKRVRKSGFVLKNKTPGSKKETKIELNDLGSIIKKFTGDSIDLGSLGNIVKTFTGGDINLGDLGSIVEKVTGKSVDLGDLGKVVGNVIGKDVEVKKPSTGGITTIVWIVIIGIGIYIISSIF